jgi:nucleotide-binding universal stress UspA family protein
MPDDSRRPVLVAFDGSDAARSALATAAELFPHHRLVVVSVWEPGLAAAMAPLRDSTGIGYVAPSAEEMAAIDRAQRDQAVDAAEAGVRLASELGATAQALPIADEADVADTLSAAAERCDAGVVVVGSRGLGGVKARLFGSTSRELLRQCPRPVLVVRAPD